MRKKKHAWVEITLRSTETSHFPYFYYPESFDRDSRWRHCLKVMNDNSGNGVETMIVFSPTFMPTPMYYGDTVREFNLPLTPRNKLQLWFDRQVARL